MTSPSVCTEYLQEPKADVTDEPVALSSLQERYRAYLGRGPGSRGARWARRARVSGRRRGGQRSGRAPFSGAVRNATRVWYAADEWFVHHMSQVGFTDRSTWGDARDAVIKGAYERAYRSKIDRAWVVSDLDRAAMRWVAGVRHVDVLPNGVDAERYQPIVATATPMSAVFWGRLDFGPNIQALQWFCRQVWPAARQRHSGAAFTIIGFNPGEEVRTLAKTPGVSLQPNLPDVRESVARHQIVVLPFVSGGGIKNKLLEAAAMGMPIVCTRKSAQGLNGTPPLEMAASPTEWVAAMSDLWTDPARARQLGHRARAWVVAEHSWEQVARTALDRLERPW